MTDMLRIHQIRVYEYVMPMKRGFGTARGVVNQARNIIISMEATYKGNPVTGLGEAAPRSARLTGDTMEGSWAFLLDASRALEGAELPMGSYDDSLDGIRSIMSDLGKLAAKLAPKENPTKPYRGVLSGIDMALLDLVARGHDVSMSVLLGQHRKRIGVTAATISSARDRATVEGRTRKHAHRFPISRVKGKGNLDTDLDLVRLVADSNKAEGVDKPVWLDVNEGLTPEESFKLIDRIVALMKARKLPANVIVEQPVSKAHSDVLPELQRRADRKLRPRWGRRGEVLKLSVMADESLWDGDDLATLLTGGGCAAINIKVQKVGGLLAGLDLARTALSRNPDIEIYIGGMLATSDVTSWALKNLAMAMPKLDYYTSVPPSNVAGRIGKPYMKYRSRTSNLLPAQKGKGHGVTLEMADLGKFVTRAARFPAPQAAATGVAETANEISEPYLLKFKKLGLDSHLLEREALRRGLETIRVAPLIFMARQPGTDKKVGFYWTAWDETSRVATYVTGNKQVTRRLLSRAGIAVPEGRHFTLEQRDDAIAYARKLGWPLVVKPQAGTGGTGVTANIRSDEELGWAIDFVAETKHDDFVVERHVDGDDYRFIVLGDEVLSVVYRRPANVIGDGVSTVAELISATNLLRSTQQQLQTRPLRLDDRARFQLERQGLAWDSVPDAGGRVTLSTSGNLSLGGDSVQVLDETHSSLLDAAVRAVAAVPGLPYAGVDFLIADHRAPIDEQDAGICEINSSPASTSHHFPLYGSVRDVSKDILEARCDHAGIPLTKHSDTLDLELDVRGVVQAVGYRNWFMKTAQEFGLSGWVRNGDESDMVEARLAGSAQPVAALASLAIAGSATSRPDSVRASHATGESPAGDFVVTA